MDFNSPLTHKEPIVAAPPAPSVEREPNVSATSPCTRCGTTEPPDEQGLCPAKSCRAARVGNKLASVHDGRAKLTPADLAARDALLDRLFAERGGRGSLDIVSQLRVEDYATATIQLGKVTRRLEMLGAVSTAGNKRSSLVDTYNVFSARAERLAAELPPPRASSRTGDTDNYENFTEDQLIERLEALLKYAHETRDLRLHIERVAAAEKAQPAPVAPTAETPTPTPDRASIVAPADPVPPTPCPYCYQWPCISVEHLAFYTLHHEAARAREDARVNKEFRLVMGISDDKETPAQPQPTDEQRRQAEVRKRLGWDAGVLNERTGYRHRE